MHDILIALRPVLFKNELNMHGSEHGWDIISDITHILACSWAVFSIRVFVLLITGCIVLNVDQVNTKTRLKFTRRYRMLLKMTRFIYVLQAQL